VGHNDGDDLGVFTLEMPRQPIGGCFMQKTEGWRFRAVCPGGRDVGRERRVIQSLGQSVVKFHAGRARGIRPRASVHELGDDLLLLLWGDFVQIHDCGSHARGLGGSQFLQQRIGVPAVQRRDKNGRFS
jgi:hypothetical protein